MSKRTPAPLPPAEPTITYSRTIKLTAPVDTQIKLSHVRELLRQARERGYDEDARVTVLDGYHGSIFVTSPSTITIADDR